MHKTERALSSDLGLRRQHKLEEALLFSGRFTDALQALNDWLYRAEPQLAEDVAVGGDKDMVSGLIDKHKVQYAPDTGSICTRTSLNLWCSGLIVVHSFILKTST